MLQAPLLPYIQHYAWGKMSVHSAVGKLHIGNRRQHGVNEEVNNLPFAEWWMGLHKSGVNQVVTQEGPLDVFQFVQRNPQFSHDPDGNLPNLPFLFKVLSVNQPLSLQIHPDKATAELLHRNQPDVYRDANHKPEIAIALSDRFECLAGFRPEEEIRSFAKEFPPLADAIGFEEHATLSGKEFLKSAFTSLLVFRSDPARTKTILEEMQKQGTSSCGKEAVETYELFCRVVEFHVDDLSALAVFLLRYEILRRGECIFVGPNTIHAYIYGDCVECMACSDNVLRGGLTAKLVDTENLLRIVSFESSAVPLIQEGISKGHSVYRPPVSEFEVHHIELKKDETKSFTLSRRSPAIAVVITGQGTIESSSEGKKESLNADEGMCLLLSKNVTVTISASTCMECYIAVAQDK